MQCFMTIFNPQPLLITIKISHSPKDDVHLTMAIKIYSIFCIFPTVKS